MASGPFVIPACVCGIIGVMQLVCMHPELLNNSLFLRYYNQWREHPESIVFVSVAEFFLMHDCIDEAVKVCHEGLKFNPDAVLGRLILAKVHIKQGEFEGARKELGRVLDIVPTHSRAQYLLEQIDMAIKDGSPIRLDEVPDDVRPDEEGPCDEASSGNDECDIDHPKVFHDLPAWKTVTMARILSSQGHAEKARAIYKDILAQDPTNEDAVRGLHSLEGGN